MRKRSLTLAGGILGTIANAAMSVFLLIAALGVLAGGSVIEDETLAAAAMIAGVICLIFAFFAITALVLNAVAITAYNGDAARYAKRRPVIITAIVFNLLLVAYFIYNMAVSGANVLAIVESLLFIAGLATSSGLLIADLCNEKKRVQPTENQQ